MLFEKMSNTNTTNACKNTEANPGSSKR